MRSWRFLPMLALLVVGIGIAVPVATAAPDAVARYLATHRVHEAAALEVPVSDVASSQQVERRAVAAQPTPISDVVSSMKLERRVAAATVGSTVRDGGFAWRDAGIGAGLALLLVAATISSLALTRRHRHAAA